MVIENHPVSETGRFPTLFWLSCPILVKRASRLEAAGHMRTVTSRMRRGTRARARLQEALERYVTRRDSHAQLKDAGAPPGGGPDRIKCLHAHLAQELADPPNPVGAETLARCGFPDCRAPCVVSRG